MEIRIEISKQCCRRRLLVSVWTILLPAHGPHNHINAMPWGNENKKKAFEAELLKGDRPIPQGRSELFFHDISININI